MASARPRSEPKQQYYDVDPFPTVQRGTLAIGQTVNVEYQNKTEEISDVQRVQVDAPPNTQVVIHRTEDNADQVVQDTVYVRDLELVDGHYNLVFKKTERDKPLTIRKNQKITVQLVNTYGFAVGYFVKIFKNRLMFYDLVTESEVSKPR